MTMGKTFLLIIGFWATLSFAADRDARTDQEIRHLTAYLRTAQCEFYRNGSWHNPEKAVAHIEKKYRYLAARGLIGSAEQFIERAATQSSLSGKPYMVKCPGSEPEPSADWFTKELMRFRSTNP